MARSPEVRIVSDGTLAGSRVFMGDKELRYVTAIDWHLDAKEGVARATLEVFSVDVTALTPLTNVDVEIRKLARPWWKKALRRA